MSLRIQLIAFFATGMALAPSQASACRIGHDQHIFVQAPEPRMLPGAEVIRVRFSTAPQAMAKWPHRTANPNGSLLDYHLIGGARLLNKGSAEEETFPVYAVVTSCSAFWLTLFGQAGPSVEGDHYLIGRFYRDGTGTRFLAGGNHNGRWHD